MAGIRHFNGSRDSGQSRIGSDLARYEMQKGGKLSTAERHKRILQKKFDEHRNAAFMTNKANKKTPTTFGEARKLSKGAQNALKELAARKARKEAKAERESVIVQACMLSNGRITKNGKILDVAGNYVGQIDSKTGKMKTMAGWSIGKYKRNSAMTKQAIQGAIDKFSPHFIHQRRLLMWQALAQMQQGYMVRGEDVINVYNNDGGASGQRQSVSATAWGARSNNVWGTLGNNAWGRTADNVWGTSSTDVWGGVGGKAIQFSGNGVNYVKKAGDFLAALFGSWWKRR